MARIGALDVAKGIGIIIVVFGHNVIVLSDKSELFRVIFSFHMPLFFLISGFFLKANANLVDFVTSRIHSLLKPYFVVSLLACLWVLAKVFYHEERFVTLSELVIFPKVLYATGETIPWVALWFLPHLFLASIISLVLIKISAGFHKKYLVAVLLFELVIGVVFLGDFSINGIVIFGEHIKGTTGLPWSIDLTPITSAFILIGYLLRDKLKDIEFDKVGLIAAGLVFFILHYCFDETIDLNMRVYGRFLISTAQALAGAYIVLKVSLLLARCNVIGNAIAYVGSGSLFILVFHKFIQDGTFFVLSKSFGSGYVAAGFSLIFGIVIPLVILEVVQKSCFLSRAMLPVKKCI